MYVSLETNKNGLSQARDFHQHHRLVYLTQYPDYRGHCEEAQIRLQSLSSFPRTRTWSTSCTNLIRNYLSPCPSSSSSTSSPSSLFRSLWIHCSKTSVLTHGPVTCPEALTGVWPFGLVVFPPGELCVYCVPAVMTWVNDTEWQSSLNEHTVQPVIYEEIHVSSFSQKVQRIWIMCENRRVVFIVLGNGSVFW